MNTEEKQDLNINLEQEISENSGDYDFLHGDLEKDNEITTNEFDRAFNEANPIIKDYILSEKFENDVKTICKIEKLENDKANIIIENVAVSILVGVLPIEDAKKTLLEAFKNTNILIEEFSIGLILKSIDAYILSDIRKNILKSKDNNKNNLEIRHLTLKQEREEKEKDELRKILLERTGILNGKGEVLIKYKDREIKTNTDGEIKENDDAQKGENNIVNRDSLLAKINLNTISDSEKIKERMLQIKIEEDERIKKLQAIEKEKEEIRKKRELLEKNREERVKEFDKENEEILKADNQQDEENQNISKIFAESLSKEINGENVEEVESLINEENNDKIEEKINTIDKNEDNKNLEVLDPYRESL